ncbi:hypothetical protein HYY73_01840 [Candidatus Woesearchaeota archaeon]|nr:hypothetical protein [Candidatus Woesearchaeota archaeon]
MTKHYMPTSYVHHSILKNIVDGNYEKQLTTGETALIERVPPDARPWFERVVIEDFYLPLRGIMRQPTETLEWLIVEVFQEEIGKAQDNGHKIKRGLTLRGSFGYHEKTGLYSGLKKHGENVTFEELIENALTAYREVTMVNIETFLQSGNSFKYVSPKQMTTSIAARMKS